MRQVCSLVFRSRNRSKMDLSNTMMTMIVIAVARKKTKLLPLNQHRHKRQHLHPQARQRKEPRLLREPRRHKELKLTKELRQRIRRMARKLPRQQLLRPRKRPQLLRPRKRPQLLRPRKRPQLLRQHKRPQLLRPRKRPQRLRQHKRQLLDQVTISDMHYRSAYSETHVNASLLLHQRRHRTDEGPSYLMGVVCCVEGRQAEYPCMHTKMSRSAREYIESHAEKCKIWQSRDCKLRVSSAGRVTIVVSHFRVLLCIFASKSASCPSFRIHCQYRRFAFSS